MGESTTRRQDAQRQAPQRAQAQAIPVQERPIGERYPAGTVLHGLRLLRYVRKHTGRKGGIHAWVVLLRCEDCGTEIHMRMHRWIQDKDVCRCQLRLMTMEGGQNGC